jgi:hypothetical protein
MIKFYNFLRFCFPVPQANSACILMTPSGSDKTSLGSTSRKPKRNALRTVTRILGALIVMALLAASGWYAYLRMQSDMPPGVAITGDFLSNDQLEAQYGVRITLIAATAMGGIVDFRYRIIDPDKAQSLLHHHIQPSLTAMDSGIILNPADMGMKHHNMLKKNALTSTFYSNIRSAVKRGTQVAVSFGDLRVGPFIAQ